MIKSLCVLVLLALLAEQIFLHAEAACDQTSCQATGEHYCIGNLPNKPTRVSLPPNGGCKDIGCADGGRYCFCDKSGHTETCKCMNRTTPCDKDKCANGYDHQCCWCFIGTDKAKKYQLPASKNCRDLLDHIGHGDGNNYCAMSECACDQYSRCTCNPPNPKLAKKAFRGFTPTTSSKCGPTDCNKNSNEYCECTCKDNSCKNHIMLTNLTSKSPICDGAIKQSYRCINAGKKCNCLNDGSCNCVDVDPLIPVNAECDECPSYSNKECVCNFKGLRFKIDSQVSNCSSLVKAKKGEIPLDSCPYQVGYECKCEFNPNRSKRQCICRTPKPYQYQQIPQISDRPDPSNVKCLRDDDCKAYTEFYCVCTNSVDYTYVTPRPLLSTDDVKKVCKGQPPNIVCVPLGYKAECNCGQCSLRPINLYNTIVDPADVEDQSY